MRKFKQTFFYHKLVQLTCVMARLMVGCVGPKSSLLHNCIFPVARYLNVKITLSSADRDLFLPVGLVITSLIKSVTNMIPARSNLYLLISSRSSYNASGSFLGEKFRCGSRGSCCCSAIITRRSSQRPKECPSRTSKTGRVMSKL